jgi:hypothetical protein
MTSSQIQEQSSPNYLNYYNTTNRQSSKILSDTSNQCSPTLTNKLNNSNLSNQLTVNVPSNSINSSQFQSPANNNNSSNQMMSGGGGILSPNQFQQLLQVITSQNQPKQFITTDCQTSPTDENINYSNMLSISTNNQYTNSRQQSPSLIGNYRQQTNTSLIQIAKSNACSQTDLKLVEEKPHANKEVNTDPIKHPSLVSTSTNTLPPPPTPLPQPPPPPPSQPPVAKKTRNQAINVNLYEETVAKNVKHYEEKVS